MLEPEEYIHVYANEGKQFIDRHVRLMSLLGIDTSTVNEQAEQAVKTLRKVNAIRMILNEYEQDILTPVLQRGGIREIREQLV